MNKQFAKLAAALILLHALLFLLILCSGCAKHQYTDRENHHYFALDLLNYTATNTPGYQKTISTSLNDDSTNYNDWGGKVVFERKNQFGEIEIKAKTYRFSVETNGSFCCYND